MIGFWLTIGAISLLVAVPLVKWVSTRPDAARYSPWAFFFVMVTIGILGRTAYLIWRHIKFRRNYLRFGTFPFFLGETMNATFVSSKNLASIKDLTLTLRFIKYERRHMVIDGKELEPDVICTQQYAETIVLNQNGTIENGFELPLIFQLPSDSKFTTRLHEDLPQYWEMEIIGEAAGVDLRSRFLVPIYLRPTPGVLARMRTPSEVAG